jgi:RNA polymerase sigma factor RpoD-like protein
MSDAVSQQSRLKSLIAKGKEQGLPDLCRGQRPPPDDISDPDQVEDIIQMINDMGIQVFEQAPDADELLLTEGDGSADDIAAAEAAAALAAVETEAGRTTDPVRMYMREMGTVELLTREGEIVIAKRIEEGIRELLAALAFYPGSVKTDPRRIRAGGQGRAQAADILVGYLDPADHVPSAQQIAEQQEIKEINRKMSIGEAKARRAKKEMVEANLRLVISIAKKYTNRGLQFLDLIQEGNIGLMKAVDKFEYRRGYKFSTYATWWIRQAITRSIADQARTIRIPVHMIETINKLNRISRQMMQEMGREPTPEELAERMEMPEDKVRKVLKIAKEPISMETPIGDDEDSHLGDFIEDAGVISPVDSATGPRACARPPNMLAGLTAREAKVLRMRFGIDMNTDHTLEEVGKQFDVTRERIRQIEAKALRKLRHPTRSDFLRSFLDGATPRAALHCFPKCIMRRWTAPRAWRSRPPFTTWNPTPRFPWRIPSAPASVNLAPCHCWRGRSCITCASRCALSPLRATPYPGLPGSSCSCAGVN